MMRPCPMRTISKNRLLTRTMPITLTASIFSISCTQSPSTMEVKVWMPAKFTIAPRVYVFSRMR